MLTAHILTHNHCTTYRGRGAAVASLCNRKDNSARLGHRLGIKPFLPLTQHAKVQHRQTWNVHQQKNVQIRQCIGRTGADQAPDRRTFAGLEEGRRAVGAQDFARDSDWVQDEEGRVAEEEQGEGHKLLVSCMCVKMVDNAT